MSKKAIILLSGGLDSTVMLGIAKSLQFECIALSFHYGQRHSIELVSAGLVAKHYQVEHKILHIDPKTFGTIPMVSEAPIPLERTVQEIGSSGIPPTYIPARNILFLSYALVQAEIFCAEKIYFGPNALDKNPYPDCRPCFVEAFQKVICLGSKSGDSGKAVEIVTPLINWNKEEIIQEGMKLKVPLHLTFSCYSPTPAGNSCSKCDACTLRLAGFKAHNLKDPAQLSG